MKDHVTAILRNIFETPYLKYAWIAHLDRLFGKLDAVLPFTMFVTDEAQDHEDSWTEWYRLSPQKRWEESMKAWQFYLRVGGSLDPEPDPQSPFDAFLPRGAAPAYGRAFNYVFVDDLDRLNRDQIESHMFIRLLEENSKRLITTDGYDSAEQSSKITHSFKAMQNDFFIDQLKVKVHRGMEDAFGQGRNLGLPPLGFKSVPKRDADGNYILNRHKKYETEVVIDEVAAEIVKRIFTIYVEQKLSSIRIARLLNDEAATGKTNWTAASVANVLKNERYIGIYTWRKTKGAKNPRTGKRMGVPRPENEQLRKEFPDMRIVSDELWQAAQERRAAASKFTRPPGIYPSRQSLYPTRLFDMYCRDCDRPLRLDRTGKYPHLCCPHGKEGKPKCGLRHSKMLRTIDTCILAHLQSRFFDDAAMDRMLEQANAFLIEEAAKPPIDLVQLEQSITKQTEQIKRLAERLANLEDGPATEILMRKISGAQATLSHLQQERELAKKNNFRPQLIDRDAFERLLTNLRDFLLGGYRHIPNCVRESPGASVRDTGSETRRVLHLDRRTKYQRGTRNDRDCQENKLSNSGYTGFPTGNRNACCCVRLSGLVQRCRCVRCCESYASHSPDTMLGLVKSNVS